jgi:hypothetical protein
LRDSHQFTVSAIHAVAANGEFVTLILQARDALFAMIAKMHWRNQHTLTN